VSDSLTPRERTLRAQLAVEASWANTSNPSARTQPGRDAANARFEREVDPDGVLPEAERLRRTEHARRSHMLKMSLKASRARRNRCATRVDDADALGADRRANDTPNATSAAPSDKGGAVIAPTTEASRDAKLT
jgi:hypothetical protein